MLRFDTRGHGQQRCAGRGLHAGQLADDVHGLLQALKVERPHFVGLSMGGMIGMTYALKYPGAFRSLVLCDTSSRLRPEAQPVWEERIKIATQEWHGTAGGAHTQALVHRGVARQTPADPGSGGRDDSRHAAGGVRRLLSRDPEINVTARLKEIRCPVQVIVGDQDAGTPVAMSREIHEAAPRSELVVIPGASHLSNLEQPEAFNGALLDFLARAA